MLKLVYQFTGSFRYFALTEELAEALKKNLLFLSKMITDPESLPKIFKKSSYIGRKIIGSSQEVQQPVKAILTWYKETIDRLKSTNIPLLKEVCGPMLELVFRTYTDQTLKDTEVYNLSTEIVDTLSSAFEEKEFFI